MEDRLRRIEGNLHTVEVVRQNALAANDLRKVAQVEDLILRMEQQITTLTARFQQLVWAGEAYSAVQPEETQMDRKHIFAINGDPDFLNIVRVLLQEEQYNVTTTNFVPRSFDQIAALQPSLLLIDLVTGERAGWELLERLHEEARTRNLPVIVASNEQRLLDRAQGDAKRYGGKGFLIKPMHLDALLDGIRELIGNATEHPRPIT